MNKPILMPQLSATRARTGLRSIGELIALLIKQYELQDQLRAKQPAATAAQHRPAAQPQPRGSNGRAVPAQADLGRTSAAATSADNPPHSHLQQGQLQQGQLQQGQPKQGQPKQGQPQPGHPKRGNPSPGQGATVEFSTSRTVHTGAKAVQSTFAWFDPPTTKAVGA